MFFSHFGLFARAQISEKEMGPYMLVYENYVGEYSASGALMTEIHRNLSQNPAVRSAREFGIYYDNPMKNENRNLRCIVGCILGGKEKKCPSELEKRFKFNVFPASKSVVCEFPLRGKLSSLIVTSRAYRTLTGYLKMKGYRDVPIMEVHDAQKGKLYFVAPVSLHPEFFDSYLK
jgi:hypothetical protein